MKLTVQDLKTPRQWRSALGCDALHFADLLGLFEAAYLSLNASQLSDRMVLSPLGTCISSESELLFFTLFSCKSGLTYDVLGLVCGMDGATAKRRQEEGLAVLREALRVAGHLPKRTFSSPAELQKYFTKRRAVLLDATEFATQRPGKKAAQKERYSGKKNDTPLNHLSSA
jgi:hypothetical protein